MQNWFNCALEVLCSFVVVLVLREGVDTECLTDRQRYGRVRYCVCVCVCVLVLREGVDTECLTDRQRYGRVRYCVCVCVCVCWCLGRV